MPPVISTTVLSWNRPDRLLETLRSYEETVSVPHELFVVDNGSSEECAVVIRDFCADVSNATPIFLPANVGGEAANQGLSRSKGDLLHISENDVRYLPGWSERVIELFERVAELGQLALVGASSSDTEIFGRWPSPSTWYCRGELLYEARTGGVATTSVIRRQLFERGLRIETISGSSRTAESSLAFPDDVGLSEQVRGLGFRVAWPEHAMVENRGGELSEIKGRKDYYQAVYDSMPWMDEGSLRAALTSHAARPKPDRTSTHLCLLPGEMAEPELATNTAQLRLSRSWTMVDARTPEMECIDLVHGIIRYVKPAVVVEARAFRGHMTAGIVKALEQNDYGRCTALEEDAQAWESLQRRLEGLESGRVNSIKVGPAAWRSPDRVDMLIVDCAWMSASEVAHVLSHHAETLNPGSLIMFLSADRVEGDIPVADFATSLKERGLVSFSAFSGAREHYMITWLPGIQIAKRTELCDQPAYVQRAWPAVAETSSSSVRSILRSKSSFEYLYFGSYVRFPRAADPYLERLDYVPEKKEFLARWCVPGSTVLDLGAHIGLFSVLMSRLVGRTGRVVSFEPTSHSRAILEETVRINGCRNVEVRPEAVTSGSSVRYLYDAGPLRSRRNSLADVPSSERSEEIRTMRLDDLDVQDVSCIKMDIEGSEIDALAGAATLLSRFRPALALEAHPIQLSNLGRSIEELWELLDELEMAVFIGTIPVDRRQFVDMPDCFETVVIPREKC